MFTFLASVNIFSYLAGTKNLHVSGNRVYRIVKSRGLPTEPNMTGDTGKPNFKVVEF